MRCCADAVTHNTEQVAQIIINCYGALAANSLDIRPTLLHLGNATMTRFIVLEVMLKVSMVYENKTIDQSVFDEITHANCVITKETVFCQVRPRA